MGITGLLPFLKDIQKNVHLSALKGTTAGVDAYCWLHRGAYSCATQIVMKTASVETLPFIKYCLRRVNLLRQHDIKPIMVFDGGYLPTKANTEKERREKRQLYLTKGKELLKQGKKSDAHDCFQKCVDISPEMALSFIKECRKLGVQCIVAPYEADAQLAYLSKEGIVDTVITEDSDLLVFGSKRVLFKMDESGYGKLIELKDLGKANKNLAGFTEDSFRQMCILSGCDYLPSVPGIGLGKSTKLMRKHRWNPEQVIRALRCENSNVPSDYDVNFKKAEYTFLYQLVFDPRTEKQVRLNELPNGIEPNEFEFAGVEQSPRKAVNMARGNINPITQEVMDMYSPSKAPPPKPPSTSWACSAMGSANHQYPVAIQAKLPLTSSKRLSRPFKPPSQSSGDILRNDELMSLYSVSTPEKKNEASLSKFFATQDGDDSAALADPESDRVEERPHGSIERETPPNSDPPLISVSQSGPKKRLFGTPFEKLAKFAFVKRRKSDHVEQELAPTQVTRSTRKNPFLKSSQQTVLSQKESVDSGRETLDDSYTSNLQNVDPSSLADDDDDELDTLNTEHTDSQSTHRSSGIVPDSGCDSQGERPAWSSTTGEDSSSEMALGGPREDSECLANALIEEEVEEELLYQSLAEGSARSLSSPVKSRSWHFGSKKKSPVKPAQRRRKSTGACKPVGLSKRMKPGRLSEPGQTQLQFGMYSYAKKPQMQL